jgi:hypothetical protein
MKNYTIKEARNFFRTRKITFREGDIQVDERDYSKNPQWKLRNWKDRTYWTDNRTIHKVHPDMPIVFPIAMDAHRIFVVCPFCQSWHMHGNTPDGYEGSRTPDCRHDICYYVGTLPGNRENTDNG